MEEPAQTATSRIQENLKKLLSLTLLRFHVPIIGKHTLFRTLKNFENYSCKF